MRPSRLDGLCRKPAPKSAGWRWCGHSDERVSSTRAHRSEVHPRRISFDAADREERDRRRRETVQGCARSHGVRQVRTSRRHHRFCFHLGFILAFGGVRASSGVVHPCEAPTDGCGGGLTSSTSTATYTNNPACFQSSYFLVPPLPAPVPPPYSLESAAEALRASQSRGSAHEAPLHPAFRSKSSDGLLSISFKGRKAGESCQRVLLVHQCRRVDVGCGGPRRSPALSDRR